MKTYKHFLFEKTFEISDDIDMIYDRYFKSFIDHFNKTGKILKTNETFATISSGVLQSEDSKKAHSFNPVKIELGIKANMYIPHKKMIHIGIPPKVVELFDHDMDIEYVEEFILPKSQWKMFRNEFTEKKLKGTISHELSHWIDDSLNKKHITNMIDNVKKEKSGKNREEVINKLLTTKTNYINSSVYEINAQVHAFKEMKRLSNNWDNITFEEAIENHPSFGFSKRFKSDSEYNSWKKKLLRRLSREGLLGKKMVKTY